MNQPARTCDAKTGSVLVDPEVTSVCQGGTSAGCSDNAPVAITRSLSMGFAAAAVSGGHGLTGDANCGQCFELHFTSKIHPNGQWGGAHEDLDGKTMIVQVNNIGYDVTGDHSFDIQIPGAGQGIFANGCASQFAGYDSAVFDCATHYGGCRDRSGCAKLPKSLQAGCMWRFDWYHWLEGDGKTNNPYVDFRRVKCPSHLTNISGSVPLDDDAYPDVDLQAFP